MGLITDLAGMRGNTAGGGKSGGSDDDKDESPLGKIIKKVRSFSSDKSGPPGGGKDISGSYLSDHATGDSYHKGGKVRKSGLSNLKKGEVVMTAKQAKSEAREEKMEGKMRKKMRGKSRGKKR